MTREELQQAIASRFSEFSFEEGGQFLNVQVPAEQWLSFSGFLRDMDDMLFDFLFCLTCVDWKTKLTMVYHLRSYTHGHELVVKCDLNREKPEIESVAMAWRTAEFHEREVFELFGVNFLHHPDLRNLILPDEWEGYPLRKDYEDPINMIKL
ncbi:MAG TPA: NADH-quinone oxidoreductase subunit C [Phnomibacter sp.]|nr:NADH-quinone oxidoreductase subunit C [Phnomibacter sp.]